MQLRSYHGANMLHTWRKQGASKKEDWKLSLDSGHNQSANSQQNEQIRTINLSRMLKKRKTSGSDARQHYPPGQHLCVSKLNIVVALQQSSATGSYDLVPQHLSSDVVFWTTEIPFMLALQHSSRSVL